MIDLALYSSDRGDTAHIIGVEARPFKFDVQREREVHTIQVMSGMPDREAVSSSPTRELVWGKVSTTGNISMVSRTPFELDKEFDLEIFSGGKHAATLRSVMLTCTLREYNLADRYIYEAQFIAAAIDKPQKTGE